MHFVRFGSGASFNSAMTASDDDGLRSLQLRNEGGTPRHPRSLSGAIEVRCLPKQAAKLPESPATSDALSSCSTTLFWGRLRRRADLLQQASEHFTRLIAVVEPEGELIDVALKVLLRH